MPTDAFTHAFRPIGLAALNDKAALLVRLDNKYVVRAPALHALAGALAERFDVLEIAGRRSFTYETCYFDDPARHCYHDHHQGRRQRLKVRMRHYVDTAQCFVEVKLKDRRGVTVKRRLACAPQQFGRLDEAALQHVRRSVEDLYGRTFEHRLEPTLQMSYRRTTLVARAGGERMTIDGALEFRCGPDRFGPAADVLILEAKSATGHGVADRILQAHRLHPTNACSKYCVGLGAAGGVSRFNRFRPAMRRLGLLNAVAAPAAAALKETPGRPKFP